MILDDVKIQLHMKVILKFISKNALCEYVVRVNLVFSTEGPSHT